MTDEDRAAKAARAKAMLKKRQQQKKAGAWAVTDPSASGSPPASRSMTPAPSQQVEGANDFGELLARHSPIGRPEHEQPPAVVSNEDLNAVVASPTVEVKASTSQDATSAAAVNGHAVNEETTQLLQEQKQTIALLVSERASLTEKLEQFDGIDIQERVAAKVPGVGYSTL
ncbi:hypothetical protein SCHPADRAFT_21675 [Schizopora paradoxa]|uniref:Uncharacterized protein n=1 Tax=Schizopora paradoxa TaxID=27342 RepID=A0A0H2SA87_9AGAM|nr:hypothetical protein SCHPADRAFT_21675 [Schizopora paradoxa]